MAPEVNSILNSVKKQCGVPADYEHFDADFIMHINTVLMIVYQLGVGEKPFTIEDATETWNDFLADKAELLQAVKSYVGLRVRMMFDPPASASIGNVYQQTIDELTSRINYLVDTGEEQNE